MFTLLSSLIPKAYAQSNEITNPAVPTFGDGTPATIFTNLIVTVWRTAVTLGGLALLVMLVVGAIGWITSGGDKGKVESARDHITQAIIGMLVLMGTIAISGFISMLFHINLLQPQFVDNLSTKSCLFNTGICVNNQTN